MQHVCGEQEIGGTYSMLNSAAFCVCRYISKVLAMLNWLATLWRALDTIWRKLNEQTQVQPAYTTLDVCPSSDVSLVSRILSAVLSHVSNRLFVKLRQEHKMRHAYTVATEKCILLGCSNNDDRYAGFKTHAVGVCKSTCAAKWRAPNQANSMQVHVHLAYDDSTLSSNKTTSQYYLG